MFQYIYIYKYFPSISSVNEVHSFTKNTYLKIYIYIYILVLEVVRNHGLMVVHIYTFCLITR
jgi:hypothetical protein